jgi:hypothetical protein
MLKKLCSLTILGLLCTTIVACTLNQPRLQDDSDCARLKRQDLYNTTNPNYEASWLTNSQQDSLKQQMAKNHCND